LVDNPAVKRLMEETGLSRLAVAACMGRGYADADSINRFFSPSLSGLTDPLTIADMDRAVGILSRARAEGSRVLIHSDYDVDGTTGGALLKRFFSFN